MRSSHYPIIGIVLAYRKQGEFPKLTPLSVLHEKNHNFFSYSADSDVGNSICSSFRFHFTTLKGGTLK